MIQNDFSLLEGAEYRMRVKLTDEAGAALDPALYHVYAGAFCPGFAPVRFRAECTETEWQLTMPGLKAGRVPWSWQLIAAEAATGVEWLLAGGEIEPLPRYAVGSGYVDPDELEVQAALDKTTLQMTVTLGESTAACSLAVVEARQSAAAAAASAQASATMAVDAASSAGESAASATASADSAEAAASSAVESKAQAELAERYAEEAGDMASAASGHAAAAAGSAVKSAASAADAATSCHAAADSASDAVAAAEQAREYAEAAAGGGGAAGGYYVPTVSAEGVLSWQASAEDMPTVAAANVKGEKGDQGEQGIQGEKGEKGDQGEQGIQGEKGEKGDQGEQGIQGIQGEKGEKGDQGEQGIQGEKGEKGDQGEQGIQGEKGDKGDQGEQGIQGEKGEKGDTGLTAEQIEILTAYASAEGQNVSIGTDGSFATQVGHTYVVTAENAVTVTQGEVTLSIAAGTQQGFVATGTSATVSDTACTVTEVFRAAATVELGGASGGEVEPEEILPAGYSAVSFFENTKEQLFVTDYTDENITAFELDFTPITRTASYAAVFGNYISESSEETMTRLIPGLRDNTTIWLFYPRVTVTKVTSLTVDCGLGMRSVVGINPNSVYGFGKKQTATDRSVASNNACPICLFCVNANSLLPTTNIYRIFRLTFWEGEYKAFEVVPCLKNGIPCFYNKVTGADYFSEQDVPVTVGLTLAQARKLDSLLPDGGGALNIAIPWGIVDINNEVTDSAVQNAITKAEQKGWTLTIKSYNE